MLLGLCFNPKTTLLLLRPITSSTHLTTSSHHPLSWSSFSRATTGSAMAVSSVRVAAAQMTSINDLAANFATCSRLVQEAASAGAKLLCFPESFSFIGANDGDSVKIAEPLDGPIMQQYRSLAR